MSSLEEEAITGGRNRPEATRFKQQTLPAWRPQMEAGTVFPLLLIAGCVFIPIGVGIILMSTQVNEIFIDYTHCNSTDAGTYQRPCSDVIGLNRNMTCTCSKRFNIVKDMEPQVYVYYKLTNFYQNHRKYVKSRDDYQLLGLLSFEVSSDCYPYDYVTENRTKKPIAPCGAIANSLFSDEISLTMKPKNSRRVDVPLLRKGIAWPSDKRVKFRNPEGDLKEAFRQYAKPVDWNKNIWELDVEDPTNNGFQNEDLIVWMRTAALPNFRKLYRLVDHSHQAFKNGFPKQADYTLNIKYSFPVAVFDGTKSIIITTMSPLGGNTRFLGTLTAGIGCAMLFLSLFLYLVHWKWGKQTVYL